MSPLAVYLLSVLKREESNATRAYHEHEDALIELGYWLLSRPVGCDPNKMSPCKIEQECRLVEEFGSYCPPDYGCGGFDVVVEVYAEVWADE